MNVNGIVKIAIYPLIILLSFFMVRQDEQYYNNELVAKRIKLSTIFIISLVVAVYSMSFNKTFWWTDVSYYDYIFTSNLKMEQSFGLDFIFVVLRKFTLNTDVLLFVMGFLATNVMLLAYRELDEGYSLIILLMFLTLFFVETVQVNLKQSLACGFAYFCIIFMLKKRYILSILFLVLAGLFHITALPILAITCVLMALMKINNDVFKIIVCVVLCATLLFYNQIFLLLEKITIGIPRVYNKLIEYDPRFSAGVASSKLVIVKGAAYYLITFAGIIYRKRFKEVIENYDQLFMVSLLASLSYLFAGIIYWMSRIVCYFWLIDILFLTMVSKRLESVGEKIVLEWGVGALLGVATFRLMFQIYL